MTIEELKEYDWSEAFNYADFNPDDIKNIIASDEGCDDGDSWVLVAELKDGTFGYLSAWCDYTGWDCQAGGSSGIRDTLEELQRWEMDSRSRRRLNMVLDDLDK